MDINYIYQIVQFIANKYQDGYLSPDEFNRQFNWAQIQYFNKLVEDLQGWDSNKRRIRLPMGNAEQVIQKLSPFKVPINSTVSPINQQVIKPNTLLNILGMRTSDDTKRIWRVESDRLPSHLASVIDPPSQSPIYCEYDGYYKVWPADIGSVNVDFLRKPNDAKWAYTLGGGGRPIFDSVNSINPEWDDQYIPEIVSRMMRELSVNLKDGELANYFQSINANGE